jgi:hypothetical protein
MDVRRRVALLSIAGGLSLAIGLPLVGLTAASATSDAATAEGDVLAVDLGAHMLRLQDTGAGDDRRGQNVTVRLPVAGGSVQPGHRPLSTLKPGQHVRVVLGAKSHLARQITELD